MGLKEVRQQHPELMIDLVELISRFDKSKTGKFTNFLVKIFKEKATKEIDPNTELRENSIPDYKNRIEYSLIYHIRDMFGSENLENLELFADHLENDRVRKEKRDINLYNSWEEISQELSLIAVKQALKKSQKDIIKVLENDEWLFIKPLSIEASLTYGAGTKWCTASRNHRDHFYRYSERGVLIYAINKVNGKKFGIFSEVFGKNTIRVESQSPEFSIWNAADDRIDTIQTQIPFHLMAEIYKIATTDKSNMFYFSESEITKFVGMKKSRSQEEVAVPAPDNDWYMNNTEPGLNVIID